MRQLIRGALGLNWAEFAEVLHLSRAEFRSWFNGSDRCALADARVRQVESLVSDASITSARPLNARFVTAQLTGGTSLLHLLRAVPLDSRALASALAEVRSLSWGADAARELREFTRRARGYRAPTADERRATLARNVALLHRQR